MVYYLSLLDVKMKMARVAMGLVLLALAIGLVKLLLWVVAGWE